MHTAAQASRTQGMPLRLRTLNAAWLHIRSRGIADRGVAQFLDELVSIEMRALHPCGPRLLAHGSARIRHPAIDTGCRRSPGWLIEVAERISRLMIANAADRSAGSLARAASCAVGFESAFG